MLTRAERTAHPFFEIRKTFRAMERMADEKLSPFGLTASQLILLSVISDPESDDKTIRWIGKETGIDRSCVSVCARILIRNGYLDSIKKEHVKCCHPYVLTKMGKKVFKEALAKWESLEDVFYSMANSDH